MQHARRNPGGAAIGGSRDLHPERAEHFRWFDVPAARVQTREASMGGLIYLIGLIVVILFILSFLGLR
jgi:hypothetical protein